MTLVTPDIIATRRAEPTFANDVISEDATAMAFIAEHGENLRFCKSLGKWFRWTETRWIEDSNNLAFHFAREIARRTAEDADERTRVSVGRSSFASGVEKFARADPVVTVEVDHWDSDPFLLGTPDGTVDLRTGALRPSFREDGITKSTLVAPVDAECPRWLEFLQYASNDDAELVRFLQQWCGYCLTGNTQAHSLVFVYGAGGNGKGVFINVFSNILADYATMAAMDTFTASKNDKHSTELARLRGSRLVTASETEQGHAWAEARIKTLTGGDKIAARFMRQDFFEFLPQFKLTIIGNHKPVLANVDDAARRRFLIVPFVRKPEKPNLQLEAQLMEEAPAILQWMIRGCIDWQQNGLIKPASVLAATEQYFSDQDMFGQWLEDSCEVQLGNERIWEKSADLFDSWTEYAVKAGDVPGTKKAFGQAMQRRGFEAYRVPGVGTRAFRFVRLRTASAGFDQ